MISTQKTLFKKAGIALLLGLAFVPALVYAQPDLGTRYGQHTGLGSEDLAFTAVNIVNTLLGLLGIILVGMFIYAGFLWLTSAGDEEKISKARKILFSSTLGVVIILSAWIIARFVLRSASDATQSGSISAGSVYTQVYRS